MIYRAIKFVTRLVEWELWTCGLKENSSWPGALTEKAPKAHVKKSLLEGQRKCRVTEIFVVLANTWKTRSLVHNTWQMATIVCGFGCSGHSSSILVGDVQRILSFQLVVEPDVGLEILLPLTKQIPVLISWWDWTSQTLEPDILIEQWTNWVGSWLTDMRTLKTRDVHICDA